MTSQCIRRISPKPAIREDEYIVDMQGFQRIGREFIFKEISILGLSQTSIPVVYLFSPPVCWEELMIEERSCHLWLQKNQHGIPWESGNVPYFKLYKVLRFSLQGARKIYVKGERQIGWLKKIFPSV